MKKFYLKNASSVNLLFYNMHYVRNFIPCIKTKCFIKFECDYLYCFPTMFSSRFV